MASRTQLLVRFGATAVAAAAALFVSIEFKTDAPARDGTIWQDAGSTPSHDAPPGRYGPAFGSPTARLSAPIREDLEPADQFDDPLTKR